MCSPLLSGVRVLKPNLKWWPSILDVFPNLNLIQQVEALTLVIHGTEDEVIAVDHGKQLHVLAKNPYKKPLWAEGYTHQNVCLCPEYIPRLQKFLDDVWD
jgi:abhydrolase domain-containing protein 17